MRQRMSAGIAGFVIGLMIGGPFGFISAAVLIASGDRWEE